LSRISIIFNSLAGEPAGGSSWRRPVAASSESRTSSASRRPIEAIGIGCTGPVDLQTGVIGTVDLLPGWEGTPLTGLLAESFHVPVAKENDADAGALGEWHSHQNDRFLFVTIGTGIGAGFILNGNIYRGVDGSHPELGPSDVDSARSPQIEVPENNNQEKQAPGSDRTAIEVAHAAPRHLGDG
jgi:hypothetical protein